MKSGTVFFQVQKTQLQVCCGTVIWDNLNANAGNGFDVSSGSFTPPRPGIYLFTFTGQGEDMRTCAKKSNRIQLEVNGVSVASANSLSMSTTLVLDTCDTVTLNLSSGNLLDYGQPVALFTGTLLEEFPLFDDHL